MDKYEKASEAVRSLGVTPFDLLAWTMARDAESESAEGVFNPTEWLDHNLVMDECEPVPVAVALTSKAKSFLED